VTNVEAILVRVRFKSTKGYNELVAAFPVFGKLIDALPNTDRLTLCNVMLQEMFEDAVKEAKLKLKEMKLK
jgi:hypothetical protein